MRDLDDIHRKHLPAYLSEYLSHPDELGTSGVRIIKAVMELTPVSLTNHLVTVAFIRDQEFCSAVNHSVSFSGFTPLHYAVLYDDEAIVRYLLQHGADPTIENNRGLRPSDYCTNEKILSLIEEYVGKVIAFYKYM